MIDPNIGTTVGDQQDWKTYRRVGRVRAERAQEEVRWQTESGKRMVGRPGDWVVRDLSGENMHTVSDLEFTQTYRKASGGTYERIGTLEARPAHPGEVIQSREGRLVAASDDWVLRDPDSIWITPGRLFHAGYELLSNS